MKALFDTNILVDYLNGIEAAQNELALYERPIISAISWIEVMVGARTKDDNHLRAFLRRFHQVAIDDCVAEKAVQIRRIHRVKLPDAIIWASAKVEGALLVTRNTKDFPANDPGVRVPYRL